MTKLHLTLASLLTLGVLAFATTSAQGAVVHEYLGSEEPSAYMPFPGSQSGETVRDESTSLSDWSKGDTYELVNYPGRKAGEGFAGEGFAVFTTTRERVGELTLPGSQVPDFGVYELAIDDLAGDEIVTGQTTSSGTVLDLLEPTMLGMWSAPRQLTTGVSHDATGGVIGVDQSAGAPGSGEFYVATSFPQQRLEEYGPAGSLLGYISGACTSVGERTPCGAGALVPFSEPGSVSIDPTTHDLYVLNKGAQATVEIFGPDIIVPDVTTGSVSHLTGRSAILTGTVNPDGAGAATCRFEWGATTAFGHTAECVAPGSKTSPIPEGKSSVPVEAQIEGLEPSTSYCYRLQATDANGTEPGEPSQDRCFTTRAVAPKIEGQFTTEVASTSATLHATVNPRGLPTTYYFQYGTTSSYGTDVPSAAGVPVGSEESGVEVSQHVQGLLADTVYHYRVVVLSEVEGKVKEFDERDQTFSTQRAGGESSLPDGRQYEMVTPLEKQGALFFGLGAFYAQEGDEIQAAAGGNAIVDLASQPTETEPQGYPNHVSVLSTRTSTGWSSQVIAPPRNVIGLPEQSLGTEYKMFSEDLSHAVVQPFGEFSPLSPEASELTAYLRSDYSNGNVGEHCQSSCFQPLVTRADDTSSPFEPFGGEPRGACITGFCGPEFVGASADLSHIILRSPCAEFVKGTKAQCGRFAQLTSTPVHTENGGLYEWFGGHLQLVSVFPKGEVIAEASTPVTLAGQAGRGAKEAQGFRRAVSENGERVIFMAPSGVGHGIYDLYLHDFGKDETIKIGEGLYFTANTEASRVFYSAAGGLNEFQVTSGPGEPLAGTTVGLTGGATNVVAVLGASDDGSYVYFATGTALTPTAVPSATCGIEEHGDEESGDVGCNLYVRHDGVTSLVAAGWIENLKASEWSRSSPDGRWLAFMSTRSLTGYDNRDAVSGRPDAEVYLYHAPEDLAAEAGALTCASCDPTGARPVGVNDGSAEGNVGWVAANVSPLVWNGDLSASVPNHQPRYLSDGGRLFFESHDSLVPQDVNGVEDVYEYEPEGVPSGVHACSASSASGSDVFKPAHVFEMQGIKGEEGAGCVTLISSGTSSEVSSLLDVSETGGDVFFLTASKLAPQDVDDAFDVYDAHECTSQSPCVSPVTAPPPCDTEASCKAPPTLQPAIYGLPASATFSGLGNLAPPPPAVVRRSQRRRSSARRGLSRIRKESASEQGIRKRPRPRNLSHQQEG